uniref:SGS domain-containing protein n=1 Tax=Syphacia muris TaxID=451379 RepID=A0A0N5AGF8_9BILA
MERPKYDFYQTDHNITITISKKGVDEKDCKICYEENKLSILVEDKIIFEEHLLHPIVPDDIKLKTTSSKIEVVLKKTANTYWETLASQKSQEIKKKCVINWDKLAKEAEEEEEKAEGEDSVNKLFQKIYADSSDDVKKAMLKSYTESAGTVLSTNWNEIKSKRTAIQPPDGLEFKKW